MPAPARPRLPKEVRRYLQRWIRNFVFFGLTWVTIWHMVVTLQEFKNSRDVLKMYGFVPGIV